MLKTGTIRRRCAARGSARRDLVIAILAILSWGSASFGEHAGPSVDERTTPEAPPAPVVLSPIGEPTSFWTRPRLTGDWGGLRSQLEDSGLSFSLNYNVYYGNNMHGGQGTGQRGSGSYDFIIDVDLEKMGLIPGGRLFAFAQGWQGDDRNINGLTGALGDPIDDADGTKVIYVDQLWYEQKFLDEKLALRFGRLDQQTIIDRNAYAQGEDCQFFNAFLDNNNAIIPLAIGTGATLFIKPTDWLGFVVGAADGDAQIFRTGLDTAFHDGADFFGYFQTDLHLTFHSSQGPLRGTYRFGFVYDPGVLTEVRTDSNGKETQHQDTGDWGVYLSFDQQLYRESRKDDQGLGIFARLGHRDGDYNRINEYWSGGLQYKGLVTNRPKDVVGFGYYSVHSSAHYRRNVDSMFLRENGFELYYRIQVTPWLTITPDVQYIARPGGDRATDDAFVMGLRARATF